MRAATRLVVLTTLALFGFAACLVGGSARQVAAAPGGPSFGVAEDASKFADDGGTTIYSSLKSLGMTENRWTVTFNGDSQSIGDQAFLDRAVPAANAAGIDVILSLFPASAQVPDPTAFCNWAGYVASRYRTVTRFIIGNEVNATRFWSPQHTPGDPNYGADTYEATLAQCYDILKQVNSGIQVIGMGLAPRAVDSNSTKPLDFIREVGAAYKASKRTQPIMDLLAVHPYPNPNASPPPAPANAAYQDPGFYGIAQLDRVKQAVYDAFSGTGQPTTVNGLRLLIDEIGYQSNETGNPQYSGSESSPTVSEAQQASYYSQVVQLYACDPAIAAVLFFHLIDEPNLNTSPTSGGWQSGLEYPNGAPKPSASAVQSAIAGGCAGAATSWSPSGAAAPTGASTSSPSALALLSESLPAGSVDGPIGDLVTLPAGAFDELTNGLAGQFDLQLLFFGSVRFDPGLVFWHSSLELQRLVLISAATVALQANDLRVGLQLANLYDAASGGATGKDAFWQWICGGSESTVYYILLPFSCDLRNLNAASAGSKHHAVEIASGHAVLGKGATFGVTLHRNRPVVPGIYLTVLKVRSMSNPKKFALLALRPAVVTAADIAKARAAHRAKAKRK